MNREEAALAIEKFLLNDVRRLLKATAGKNPDLSKVIVWLKMIQEDQDENVSIILGLALGSGTGCSPFCGCAANQIAEFIEEKLKSKFSWLKRVRGEAAMPSEKELKQWNDS